MVATPGNALNITAAGIPVFNGTSTFTATTTTQFNILTGAASNAINNVAPSATSGIPVISQGSSSQPIFGTAVVAGGGTGAVTLTGVLTGNGTSAITANTVTQHGVLIGGATNAVASLGVASTGTVLAGNTGADPSFQSLATIGGITTITGNSGGAEVPSSGNFNVLGTGSITVAGTANTETVQLTGLTNHNVLVGAGTATITNVAPSATAGVPLVSAGASADPSFTTAVVGGGGTGNISQPAYSLVCGGTTTTGAFQSVADVAVNQVLISGGVAALPSFSAFPQISGLGVGASAGSTAGITFDGSNFMNNYVANTSWTPALQFGGASVGITYSTQVGSYCRIGNVVFIAATIILTSKGSSSGACTIGGLPFTASNTLSFPLAGYFNSITFTTNATYALLAVNKNTTTIILGDTGSGTTSTLFSDTNFTNTSSINLCGFYFVP